MAYDDTTTRQVMLDLMAIALHESGHVIAGLAVGFELRLVEVFPTGGGLTTWRDADDAETPQSRESREESTSLATVMTRAARIDALRANPDLFPQVLKLIFRDFGSTAGIVKHLITSRAARIAEETILSSGDRAFEAAIDDEMSEDLLLCALDDPRTMALVDSRSRALAESLVRRHRQEIVLLAAHLAKRWKLTGDQVREIIASAECDRHEADAA